MIELNERLYENLLAGADRYYSYAKTLLAKIPSAYREAAQDGTIAIEEFVGEVDEKTLEAIQDYRDWVQKGTDATQQAEEVLTEISTLAKKAIDNISDDYGNKNSIRDSEIDQLNAYNELTAAKFGTESANIYQEIIKETNNISEKNLINYTILTDEYSLNKDKPGTYLIELNYEYENEETVNVKTYIIVENYSNESTLKITTKKNFWKT